MNHPDELDEGDILIAVYSESFMVTLTLSYFPF